MAVDPRIAANFVLETREFLKLETTQIELQKLLYFSHESFLLQNRRPLTKGYFEAWTYGPVHPEVYNSFKKFGGSAITGRAKKKDLFTKQEFPLDRLNESEMVRHIVETVTRFSRFSAAELVGLSHAKGGPWHTVVESAKKSVALGMRITDDVILRNRTHSMLMREGRPAAFAEELPNDESPLAGNRYREDMCSP